MKKRKILTYASIILISLFFIVIGILNYKKNDFLTFSLFEILTLGIALVFAYYFTKRDKQRDALRERIFELINKIICEIDSPLIKIEKDNFSPEEMLMKMRCITNYIFILNQYKNKFIETKHIDKISNYWKNYKDLVSDDLANKELLLLNKNKIHKALVALDSELTFTLFSLYDDNLKDTETKDQNSL